MDTLFIEAIKWTLILCGIMGVRIRKDKYTITGVVMIAISFLLNYTRRIDHVTFEILVAAIFLIFFTWGCFKERAFKLLCTIYIISILDIIIGIIIPDQVFEYIIDTTYLSKANFVNILGMIVCLIIFLGCRKQSIQFAYYIDTLSKVQFRLFIIGIISSGLTIGFSQVVLESDVTQKMKYVMFILLVIEALVFIVLTILLTLLLKSKKELEYERCVLKNSIIQQKEYFMKSDNQNKSIRKFKHDYNNHLLLLQKYLEDNEVEKAKEYIVKMSALLPEVNHINTGNNIVNSIANHYFSNVQEENIRVFWDGKIPENCGIEDIDLCLIFSNIISNALEGIIKLEKSQREIRISSELIQHILIICESNPISEEIYMNNGLPVTSKEDKINHGFGLETVKNVVKKYQGEMNIEINTRYKIELLFHVLV